MAETAEKLMTVAEFLTWDDGTDTRYELVDGRPVAMAPVTAGHPIIAVNLGHALRSAQGALLRGQ
jgi:Uma2 family endonuclease